MIMNNDCKIGIEIHQQHGKRKLFCSCLASNTSTYDSSFTRKFFVFSDAYSFDDDNVLKNTTSKSITYQYSKGKICDVERDDSPPEEINKEALLNSIRASILLNCRIFSGTRVMRKLITDGSLPSGFQRTAFIAEDGYFQTSFGNVRVSGIYLEEDSAQKISEVRYDIERCGYPLIEIVLNHNDIKSPENAEEAARKLRDLLYPLRDLNMKIGGTRQDINISSKEHPRTELKGISSISLMAIAIQKELERQKNENIKEESTRLVLPNGSSKFMRYLGKASRMYLETDISSIIISKSMIEEAKSSIGFSLDTIKEEYIKGGAKEEEALFLIKDENNKQFSYWDIYQFGIQNNVSGRYIINIFLNTLRKDYVLTQDEIKKCISLKLSSSQICSISKELSSIELSEKSNLRKKRFVKMLIPSPENEIECYIQKCFDFNNMDNKNKLLNILILMGRKKYPMEDSKTIFKIVNKILNKPRTGN